jgi:predicted RNA binding protein YcfA (HicA-like mRNA interferase family)
MNWFKKIIFAGLPVFNTREVLRKLRNSGANFYRSGKGSHEIWIGPNGQKMAISVGAGGQMINPRTLRKIVQYFGINYNQFLSS